MLIKLYIYIYITCTSLFILIITLGLRGAISYALSLHLEFSNETRHVIITTTLCIILVTTLLFGGSTMPLMKVKYYQLNLSRVIIDIVLQFFFLDFTIVQSW